GVVELEGDAVAAQLRRRLLGEVEVEVADRDPGSAADQRLRGALADPAGTARDRYDLPRYRLDLLARHDRAPLRLRPVAPIIPQRRAGRGQAPSTAAA